MLRLALTSLLLLVLASTASAQTPVTHLDPPQFGLPDKVADPVFASRPATVARRGGTGPATTWCGTERGTDDTVDAVSIEPRYKVIYAYPSDQVSRFANYQDLMQKSAAWVSDKIGEASNGTLGVRFDYGTDCGPSYLDIAEVRLPRPRSAYTADQNTRLDLVTGDVQAAGLGLGAGKWNYLIFADYTGISGGAAGQGQLYLDDSPSTSNYNNRGGLSAVIYGFGGANFSGGSGLGYTAYATTHEVGHTLGAVQDSAPNSTGNGHCRDGYAIMCYADGGPNQTQLSPAPCAGTSSTGYDGIPVRLRQRQLLLARPGGRELARDPLEPRVVWLPVPGRDLPRDRRDPDALAQPVTFAKPLAQPEPLAVAFPEPKPLAQPEPLTLPKPEPSAEPLAFAVARPEPVGDADRLAHAAARRLAGPFFADRADAGREPGLHRPDLARHHRGACARRAQARQRHQARKRLVIRLACRDAAGCRGTLVGHRLRRTIALKAGAKKRLSVRASARRVSLLDATGRRVTTRRAR